MGEAVLSAVLHLLERRKDFYLRNSELARRKGAPAAHCCTRLGHPEIWGRWRKRTATRLLCKPHLGPAGRRFRLWRGGAGLWAFIPVG